MVHIDIFMTKGKFFCFETFMNNFKPKYTQTKFFRIYRGKYACNLTEKTMEKL